MPIAKKCKRQDRDYLVFIQGAYGPSNLGDDALMVTCAGIIGKIIPPEKIAIGVQNREIAKKLAPNVSAVSAESSGEVNAAALIYGGGGQFFSFPGRMIRSLADCGRKICSLVGDGNALKRMFRSLRHFRSGRGIRVQSRHKAAYCVGVGPFAPHSRKMRKAAGELRECSYISVRDEGSRRNCGMLGIDEVELYTDPCFYHDFLSGDASRTDQAISSHVGIVVREWNHDEAGKMHWRPLLEAADVLQERGIACTFILLDKKNDASIYRKLKNRNCLVWDPGGDSIGGFIDKMSSPFDIIISARAHGIILPAVKGVPGICIELEPKLFHVHRMLPRGTLLWGFPFSVSDLLDKVGMIYGDYDSFTRGIAHDVALNRNKAICSSQKITQWLDRVLRS